MASYKLKVVALGDVGDKGNLLRRCTQYGFEKNYKMTIGCDVFTKRVFSNDDIVTLSIWDIAGQERFRYFRSGFYRGSIGIMIFFDTTRYSTFNPNVVNWIREVWSVTGRIPVVLFGTKGDMVNERAVRHSDVEAFAENIPCRYFENGMNTSIEEALTHLTGEMVNALRDRSGLDVIPRPTYEGPIHKGNLKALIKDLGITHTKREALVFREKYFFRVEFKTGDVFVHCADNPDRSAKICLEPLNAGWSNTTLKINDLILIAKISALVWDDLPPQIYPQIDQFLLFGKKGANVFPRSSPN